MKVFMCINENELDDYLSGKFKVLNEHRCHSLYNEFFELIEMDNRKRVYWGFTEITKKILMNACQFSGIDESDNLCLLVDVDIHSDKVHAHDYYAYSDYSFYKLFDNLTDKELDIIKKVEEYFKSSSLNIKNEYLTQVVFQVDKLKVLKKKKYKNMDELCVFLNKNGMIKGK